MNFQFTFKHMDSSDALMELVREKIAPKIECFSSRPVHAHVTFWVEGILQKIHVSIIAEDGYNVEVEHGGTDMYTEVDVVADRVEAQMRKHKEKIKQRKGAIGLKNGQPNAPHEDLSDVVEADDAIDAGDILNLEVAKHPEWEPVTGRIAQG